MYLDIFLILGAVQITNTGFGVSNGCVWFLLFFGCLVKWVSQAVSGHDVAALPGEGRIP